MHFNNKIVLGRFYFYHQQWNKKSLQFNFTLMISKIRYFTMHKKSKSIHLDIDCDDRHIIKLFEQFVIESMVGEIKLHIKKILGKLNFSLDYFFFKY